MVNKLPDVGTIHKTATLEYKITASSEAEKTVIVQKSLKKNAKKIAVPAIVEIEGYEYKVTEIKAGAFKNRQYADQLLYELLDQGYPAFLLDQDGYFKVQVGAYLQLGNAIAMEQRLRDAGYSTLITTK